jgi:hypothetical protein
MRKRIIVLLLIVAVLSLGMVGMAHALPQATWQFAPTVPGNITGDIGSNTFTFTDTTSGANVHLPVESYLTTNAPPSPISIGDGWEPGSLTNVDLFAKVTAGDPGETGLGLAGQTANEIQLTSIIALDTFPMKHLGYHQMTLGIGSMQVGEGYYLWGIETGHSAAPWILLATGVGPPVVQTINIPDFDLYEFFAISATPPGSSGVSDVLILNGATAVPLPGAVFLLGSGLISLLGYGRSRKYLKS